MKKIILTVAVAFITAITTLTGCKSIPSATTVETTAYAIGVVGGYACELSKTKTSVREGIVTVLDIAAKVTPATNETFVAAWTPIIDEEVGKLVTAGKISEMEGTLIKNALNIAASSIDFMFTRHPTWKEYQELVSAAVDGFVSGFESVVKSTDDSARKSNAAANDIEAYQAFLNASKK